VPIEDAAILPRIAKFFQHQAGVRIIYEDARPLRRRYANRRAEGVAVIESGFVKHWL